MYGGLHCCHHPNHYRRCLPPPICKSSAVTTTSSSSISFFYVFYSSVNLVVFPNSSTMHSKAIHDQKVVKLFENCSSPIYHMIGYHCLYNLPRQDLLPLLKIAIHSGQAYYDFSPTPEYKFVVLDGYNISAIGWPHDHPKTMEAMKILQEKNPNCDKNSHVGIIGLERRFLMFNGAVGREKMVWLDEILQDSTKLGQNVVVCCHMPLDPGAVNHEALCWNYDEVMEVIHRYDCVKVCIAGHNHPGGYSIGSHSIHHRVIEASLECPPGSNAFGFVHAYDDILFPSGTDRMTSTEMIFSS